MEQDFSNIINLNNGVYSIRIGENSNPNDISELISMFLPPKSYEISTEGKAIATDKDELKRIIYRSLSKINNNGLKWGILTGVKPLKLYSSIVEKFDEASANNIMREEYYLDDEPIKLLSDAYHTQKSAISDPLPNTVSLYLGIPFCPSRCAYCSFTSNVAKGDSISKYLAALYKEIDYVGNAMLSSNMKAESIYVGGGTPTTLSPLEMDSLLTEINHKIPSVDGREFTYEAGRPDTLTNEKCKILSDYNVDRLSINPQSMNPKTLELIGRNHNETDIIRAFDIVRNAGNYKINADIIAGLPGEGVTEFKNTLDRMLDILPENITIHTLSIKKGSELRELNAELCYNNKGLVSTMLSGIAERMSNHGYNPYYLYRQKRMLDNLENVGYALPGTECVYNIRIMEEKQTIIALGAGGSSKVYFKDENRIERVFNVSNYEIYIDKIDEMIKRKEEGIFKPLEDK